jgi:hypothetical protein
MRQRLETPDNNYSRGKREHAGLVDDVPRAAPDWADKARSAWDAPGWQAAAANDVSLGLNDQRRRGEAAATTVEALMMGLRERGIAALTEPKVRHRLSECDEQQVAEVGNRLQKLKPEILRLGKGKLHRGWTAEEVEILLQTWGALR